MQFQIIHLPFIFHLCNNGSTVGTFQVKIPATVTYDWGELKTEVVVTVEKTKIGGAKRK